VAVLFGCWREQNVFLSENSSSEQALSDKEIELEHAKKAADLGDERQRFWKKVSRKVLEVELTPAEKAKTRPCQSTYLIESRKLSILTVAFSSIKTSFSASSIVTLLDDGCSQALLSSLGLGVRVAARVS